MSDRWESQIHADMSIQAIQTAVADLMPLVGHIGEIDAERLEQTRAELDRLLQMLRFPILRRQK